MQKYSSNSLEYHFDKYKYWFDMDNKIHYAVEYNEKLPEQRQPPVFLQIAVTNLCNLNCDYCYAKSGRSGTTTWTLNSLFKVISKFSSLGTTSIAFGGGEPFAVNWFIDLLERLDTELPITKTVTTNGTLIDDKLASRLQQIDVKIRVSINSLSELRHRREGLLKLEEYEIRTGINSILKKSNDFLHGYEIIDFANKFDLLLLEPQNIGRGAVDKLSEWDIKSVVLSLATVSNPQMIKLSSSLSSLFYDENIKWQYPVELSNRIDFFGSIDHEMNLRHSSFCPEACGKKLRTDTNVLDLWQSVIKGGCLLENSLYMV